MILSIGYKCDVKKKTLKAKTLIARLLLMINTHMSCGHCLSCSQ